MCSSPNQFSFRHHLPPHALFYLPPPPSSGGTIWPVSVNFSFWPHPLPFEKLTLLTVRAARAGTCRGAGWQGARGTCAGACSSPPPSARGHFSALGPWPLGLQPGWSSVPQRAGPFLPQLGCPMAPLLGVLSLGSSLTWLTLSASAEPIVNVLSSELLSPIPD